MDLNKIYQKSLQDGQQLSNVPQKSLALDMGLTLRKNMGGWVALLISVPHFPVTLLLMYFPLFLPPDAGEDDDLFLDKLIFKSVQ